MENLLKQIKSIFLVVCIGLVLLTACKGYGQNLVKNPSFENDTIPYVIWDSMAFFLNFFGHPCVPWFLPTVGSSDYLSESYGGYSVVPENGFGYSYARTGIAYMGVGVFVVDPNNPNYREYIAGILLDSLIQNHVYEVAFFVKLGSKSQYAADGMGAYLSKDSLSTYFNSNNFIPVNPQIENVQGNILNDTTNWTEIKGYFTATGGEKFIIIGNFKDDANTLLDSFPGFLSYFSYYFIDDVSVIDCTVGINETGPVKFSLTPNPVTDKLFVTLENNQQASNKISITNTTGQILWEQTYAMATRRIEINVSGWPPGIYFITMQNNGGRLTRKFVKL